VKLSPRGIEQGWMKELEASTTEHRKWVTDAKARGLFQVCVHSRRRACFVCLRPFLLLLTQVARGLRSCRDEYERQAQEIADLDYNLKLVHVFARGLSPGFVG
jgi:hypothetical protein